MYAVGTFQKNVRESRYVFDFRLGNSLFQTANQKIRFNLKILCSQSSPFSRAKPAERNERAMETRMPDILVELSAAQSPQRSWKGPGITVKRRSFRFVFFAF